MKRALFLFLLLAPQAAAVDLLDRLELREQRIGKRDDGRPIYAVVASLTPMRYFAAPMPYFQLGAFPGGGGGGGITIGTTTITGGATTEVLYNLAGVISSDSGFTRSGLNGTTTISNGTGAVSPLVVKDNLTTVFEIADGGNVTGGSSNTWSVGSITIGGSGLVVSSSATLSSILANAATNTFATPFTFGMNSSGAAASGFGSGQKWQLESSTTNSTDAGAIGVRWKDATHASRTAEIVGQTVQNAGTMADAFVVGGRSKIISGSKDNITEGSAQAIVRITMPSSGLFAAYVSYLVSDGDGTDFVGRGGTIQIQGANKAGTSVCTINTARDTEAEDGSQIVNAAAAFTLTYTWTNVVNTTSCDLSLNGASSAGTNTYDISYIVYLTTSAGGATVTPQ